MLDSTLSDLPQGTLLVCVYTTQAESVLDRFDSIARLATAHAVQGVYLWIESRHLAWAHLLDPDLVRCSDRDLIC